MASNSDETRPIPDDAPTGPGEGLAAEALLWRRLRDHDDPAAREELVRRYLPFAKNLALRYRGASESFDDLCRGGNRGRFNAVTASTPPPAPPSPASPPPPSSAN